VLLGLAVAGGAGSAADFATPCWLALLQSQQLGWQEIS
jgi:hypothetical protein